MGAKVRGKPRRGAQRVKRLARSLKTEHWPKGNGKRFAEAVAARSCVK